MSGIPNSICDEDLENTVINICKESGIDADARKILRVVTNSLSQGIAEHSCSNNSSLEMEAECLTKTSSNLNLNISRTKNARNKL